MHSFFEKKSANTASTQSTKKAAYLEAIPWVEKYRPKKVSELVFQDEVVAVLNKCIQGADLPNLLFYGPPGTGKTSAAVALCRQLFRNPDAYKDRVLELNASDERGIEVVRTRIKNFARQTVNTHLSNVAIPGLRIIILDEADAMTSSAQSALRRTMERESASTRFMLICNYVSRIIDPLTSRCAKFRFKPLPNQAQTERVKLIAERENVTIEDDAIDELVEMSNGDLRKSITILQSISSSGKLITAQDVRERAGFVPDEIIHELVRVCESPDFNALFKFIKKFRSEGYGVYQTLLQLSDVIMTKPELNSTTKAKIFQKMGEVEKNLIDGASEYLAILEMATIIQQQMLESEAN
uniref:AAA+ ATPase domain-containing protein n=1 Tax=Panagrolaimus sp. PS1159 TaxID=55785 RepID=A0AC35FY46_9BILA